jgi:hypothetical protein
MKKAVIIALLGAICLNGKAQNEIDALRYSFTNYEGSARLMGMGGAFGALGGDVSAVGINPASMARFSKNEFSFSLGSAFYDASANLYQGTGESSKTNINIPNVGFVGTHNFKNKERMGWQSIQFGITYNRTNNFNEEILIQGQTPYSYSLVFADWADGNYESDLVNTNNYDSYLAYNTWLIDPASPGASTYLSTINGGTDVRKSISRTGRMGSTELALSGNYMNKLYVGGSIGIPTLKFTETATHYESVTNDSINTLDNFSFTQNLTTRGSGYNLKLGLVALPTDWIRLGVSLQTATTYRLSDRWNNSMTTNFDDGNTYSEESDNGSYVYKLKTPMKITGSAAFIIFKKAAVSIDYEMVDYSKSRLGSTPYTSVPYGFTNENTAIGNIYRKASSIRLGSEIKLTNEILARAGVQYRQNPMVEITAPQINYSAGIGYRVNNFYIDAAYILSTASEDYYLYDPVLIEQATINKNISKAMVTIGFRY